MWEVIWKGNMERHKKGHVGGHERNVEGPKEGHVEDHAKSTYLGFQLLQRR